MRQQALPSLRASVGPIVCAFSVVVVLWLRLITGPFAPPVDLDVYLMGARTVSQHISLYSVSIHDLFFTYPPFSAVMFMPLAKLNQEGARVAFLVLSWMCYLLSMVIVGRKLGFGWGGVGFLVVAGGATEPFFRTSVLGQVNMLLMALVVVDTLVIPPKWRGWLVGLAAGIKIIPGVFILYFLIQRDIKAALRALVGLAVSIFIGVLVAPADSWNFWSGGFLGLGRFGEAAVIASDNQSLVAILMRLTHDPSPAVAMSLLTGALGVACGALVAWRLASRGDNVGAVVALGFGGLLASPISWTHHWIWVIPLLGVLASRGWWVSCWIVGAVFTIGPMWALGIGNRGELEFGPVEVFVSASYAIVGLVVLGKLAWSAGRSLPPLAPVTSPSCSQPERTPAA